MEKGVVVTVLVILASAMFVSMFNQGSTGAATRGALQLRPTSFAGQTYGASGGTQNPPSKTPDCSCPLDNPDKGCPSDVGDGYKGYCEQYKCSKKVTITDEDGETMTRVQMAECYESTTMKECGECDALWKHGDDHVRIIKDCPKQSKTCREEVCIIEHGESPSNMAVMEGKCFIGSD